MKLVGTIPSYPKYDNWYADTAKYEAEESHFWRRQNTLSKFGLVINGLTLAAAIVAGYVAYNAFVQTKRQAGAAEEQIEVAKGVERRQLRAYVTVDAKKAFGLSAQKNKVEIIIQNTGLTPARHVVIAGDPTIAFGFDTTRPATKVQKPSETYAEYFLPTGEIIISRNIVARPNTPPEMQWPPGQIRFNGTIYYEDIFGQPQWTVFCFAYSSAEADPERCFGPVDGS